MNDLLSREMRVAIANLALAGITREFPHKPDHVLFDVGDAKLPRELHPAFYGCYDWHSAVHSHWVLVTLLEDDAVESQRAEVLQALSQHFSAQALQSELDYLKQPGRQGFERPYGWAWIWSLQSVVAQLAKRRNEAASWATGLAPIGEVLMERWLDWLARQAYPCRQGTHANTAFALSLAIDFSAQLQNHSWVRELQSQALRLYVNDHDFSIQSEPSANDFLSPVILEAALMTRCLNASEWLGWWKNFIRTPEDVLSLQPATVNDRTDAQGVHLDGLNLSRAWHAAEVAAHLSSVQNDAWLLLARRHWHAGIQHVCSGDFLGEHWLGTFALAAAQKLSVCSSD